MTATATGTGACASCDYGISVSAVLSAGDTTCPADLYAGDETWTTTYAVDEKPDGTAVFTFASSGNEVGQGYVSSPGVSFSDGGSCTWF